MVFAFIGWALLDSGPPWLGGVIGAVVGAAAGWALSIENRRKAPDRLVIKVLYALAIVGVIALAVLLRS